MYPVHDRISYIFTQLAVPSVCLHQHHHRQVKSVVAPFHSGVTLAMTSPDSRNFISSIIISQDYNGPLFIETRVTTGTLQIRFLYVDLGMG